MASEPAILKELVYMIGRLFYTDKYIILFDMLAEERVLRDDTIACRTKFPIKESNKYLSKLKDDKWIKCESKTFDVKLNDFQSKTVSRNYYYIDYQQLINLLKYKMYRLRELAEKSLKSSGSLEGKGYFCKRCESNYTLLESSFLFNAEANAFFCEHCTFPPSELELFENTKGSGNQSGGSDPEGLFSRFMIMSAPVIDILKKTDQLIIPSFHLSDYIESANQAAAEANEENAIHIITAEDALQASLTKISPTSASPDHVIKESITVDIQAPSETNYQEFYNTSDAPSKEVETTPIELPKEIISADEPKVSVSGEMISLSQIDDVIMEKMTTEEYEEYYRILCSQ